MLGGIGTSEILLIFLVALLLFGAKRIPEIAKGLGKGINEFKHALHDVKGELEEPPPTAKTPSTQTASTERPAESSEPQKKANS